MSLIRSSHLRLVGAALLAVILPGGGWTEPPTTQLQRCPILDAPFAPEAPPVVPEQALAGRLFFGPIDTAGSADAVEQGGEAASAPPPVPTLLGTATSRRGRAVAVLRLASGETRLAGRGDSVDGWTVSRIAEARITLRNQDVTRTLELPRSTAAASPSAQPSVR